MNKPTLYMVVGLLMATISIIPTKQISALRASPSKTESKNEEKKNSQTESKQTTPAEQQTPSISATEEPQTPDGSSTEAPVASSTTPETQKAEVETSSVPTGTIQSAKATLSNLITAKNKKITEDTGLSNAATQAAKDPSGSVKEALSEQNSASTGTEVLEIRADEFTGSIDKKGLEARIKKINQFYGFDTQAGEYEKYGVGVYMDAQQDGTYQLNIVVAYV